MNLCLLADIFPNQLLLKIVDKGMGTDVYANLRNLDQSHKKNPMFNPARSGNER